MALIEPITKRNEREQHLGNLAVAICTQDLDRAVAISEGFDKISTSPDLVKLRIAYRIGASRPADAIRIVEGMNSYSAYKMKAEAFGWLAVAVAARDKPFAYSLIDRSLSMYMNGSGELSGFSGYGGRSVMAAQVASQAEAIGYPDRNSLVYRVLAMLWRMTR